MKTILYIAVVVLFVACSFRVPNESATDTEDTDSDSDTSECQQEQTRCVFDMLQTCTGGQWTDWTDCGLLAERCVMIEGEAQCTGVDTDSDSDTDTDTTGLDLGFVNCNGTPSNCDDIGQDEWTQYWGCCDGDVLFFCLSGVLDVQDCSETQGECVLIGNAYMACG